MELPERAGNKEDPILSYPLRFRDRELEAEFLKARVPLLIRRYILGTVAILCAELGFIIGNALCGVNDRCEKNCNLRSVNMKSFSPGSSTSSHRLP